MKKIIQKAKGRKDARIPSAVTEDDDSKSSKASHFSHALKTLSPFSFGKSKKSNKQLVGSLEDLQGDAGSSKDAKLTKLHKACLNGDVSKAADLVKKSDVDALDASQRTPLHISSACGHRDIVLLLLDAKANVNAQDVDGNTPLISAVLHGQANVVKVLLENGSNVETVDANGNTPLHLAMLQGQSDIALLLLDHYKNVDIQNLDGTSLLHVAASRKQLGLVKKLLEKGANVNITDNESRTPLMLASQSGIVPMVNSLLDFAADVSLCDNTGKTFLDYANLNGHRPAVESLLFERQSQTSRQIVESRAHLEAESSKQDEDSWNESARDSDGVCERVSSSKTDKKNIPMAKASPETTDSPLHGADVGGYNLSQRIADQLSSKKQETRDFFEEFGLSDVSESSSITVSKEDDNQAKLSLDQKVKQEVETDVEDDPFSFGYVATYDSPRRDRPVPSQPNLDLAINSQTDSTVALQTETTPTRPPRKRLPRRKSSNGDTHESNEELLHESNVADLLIINDREEQLTNGLSKLPDSGVADTAVNKPSTGFNELPDIAKYKLKFEAKQPKSDSESDWSDDSFESPLTLESKHGLNLSLPITSEKVLSGNQSLDKIAFLQPELDSGVLPTAQTFSALPENSNELTEMHPNKSLHSEDGIDKSSKIAIENKESELDDQNLNVDLLNAIQDLPNNVATTFNKDGETELLVISENNFESSVNTEADETNNPDKSVADKNSHEIILFDGNVNKSASVVLLPVPAGEKVSAVPESEDMLIQSSSNIQDSFNSIEKKSDLHILAYHDLSLSLLGTNVTENKNSHVDFDANFENVDHQALSASHNLNELSTVPSEETAKLDTSDSDMKRFKGFPSREDASFLKNHMSVVNDDSNLEQSPTFHDEKELFVTGNSKSHQELSELYIDSSAQQETFVARPMQNIAKSMAAEWLFGRDSSEASENFEDHVPGASKAFDSKEGTLGRLSTLHGVDEIWEQNTSVLIPKLHDSQLTSPNIDTESSATFTESDNEDSRAKENSETDDTASDSLSVAVGSQITPSMLSSPSRLNEVQTLLSYHKVALEKEKCKTHSLKTLVKTLTKDKDALNCTVQSLQLSSGQSEKDLLRINSELTMLQYRIQEESEEKKTLAVLLEEVKLQLEHKHAILEKESETREKFESEARTLADDLKMKTEIQNLVESKLDLTKEEMDKNISELNFLMSAASQEKSAMVAKLEEQAELNKKLEEKSVCAKAEMEQIVEELKLQVLHVTQENNDLKNELEVNNKINEKVVAEKTEVAQQLETLKLQLKKMEDENIFLQKDLEERSERSAVFLEEKLSTVNAESLHQLEGLKHQIVELATENEALRQQLSKQEQNETDAVIFGEKLSMANAETVYQMEGLKHQIEEVTRKNENLHQHLTEKTEENQVQNKMFEELKAQANEEMEKLRLQMTEMTKENALLKSQVEGLDDLNKGNLLLTNQIKALQSELAKKNEQHNSLKTLFEENEKVLHEKLAQTQSDMEHRLEQMTEDNAKLKKELDESKAHYKELEVCSKAEMSQKIERWNSNLTEMKEKNDALNIKLKEQNFNQEKLMMETMLQSKLDMNSQIENLSTQVSVMAKENEDLRNKIEEQSGNERTLWGKTIEESKREIQDQFQSMMSQIAEITQEKRSETIDQQNVAEEKSSFSKIEMQQLLDTMKLQIEEVNQRNTSMRSELDENSRTQKKMKEKFHQSNIDLKHQLERLMLQVSDLTKENKELKSELQEYKQSNRKILDNRASSSCDKQVAEIKLAEEEAKRQLAKVAETVTNELTNIKKDRSQDFLYNMQNKLENQFQELVKQSTNIEEAIRKQANSTTVSNEDWKQLKKELAEERLKYTQFLERQASYKADTVHENNGIKKLVEELQQVRSQRSHLDKELLEDSNIFVASQTKERLDSLVMQMELLKNKMEVDKDLRYLAEIQRTEMTKHHLEQMNKINRLEKQFQTRSDIMPFLVQENSTKPLSISTQKNQHLKEPGLPKAVQQYEFVDAKNQLTEDVALLRTELAADRERTEALVREISLKSQALPSTKTSSTNRPHYEQINVSHKNVAVRTEKALPKWPCSPVVNSDTVHSYRYSIEAKLDQTFKNVLQSSTPETIDQNHVDSGTSLRRKFFL